MKYGKSTTSISASVKSCSLIRSSKTTKHEHDAFESLLPLLQNRMIAARQLVQVLLCVCVFNCTGSVDEGTAVCMDLSTSQYSECLLEISSVIFT